MPTGEVGRGGWIKSPKNEKYCFRRKNTIIPCLVNVNGCHKKALGASQRALYWETEAVTDMEQQG